MSRTRGASIKQTVGSTCMAKSGITCHFCNTCRTPTWCMEYDIELDEKQGGNPVSSVYEKCEDCRNDIAKGD